MQLLRGLLIILGFTIGGIVVVILFGLFLLLVRDTFSTSKTTAPLAINKPIAPLPPPTVIQPTTPIPVPVALASTTENPLITPDTEDKGTQSYITVTDGCGPHFEGDCLNARSGPGTDYPSVGKLRNGIVLKVGEVIENETGTWYKIVFDEWLRYPERLQSKWYVSADHVELIYDDGELHHDGKATSSKRIVVDRGDQTLVAYDGEEIFFETKISTGLELTPTPRGTFTIFKKTPSRYMQGPLPYLTVSKYYDLPGVPWNMYFTEMGAVIHGTYWHDNFGSRYSSGCVNVDPNEARLLYEWAELGTTVTVRD